MTWGRHKWYSFWIVILALGALTAPLFVSAQSYEPNLDIGYVWDPGGVNIRIEEGGQYAIPLNVRKSARYEFEGRNVRGAIYAGTLHNAKSVTTHFMRSGPTNLEVDSFSEYGKHFIVVYGGSDLAGINEWFENGTSTNPDVLPPPAWGIINFEIIDPNAEQCCSNVAFIPGIQASRLYMDEGGSENRLWEPNTDSDGQKLAMTEAGESVNDVYTADVIDKAGPLDIYQSFIDEMDGLVDEGTIAEWQALPYDWRNDVFDVAREEVALIPGGDGYKMIEEIEELSETSKTGKVTLVTHSNGGLVGKALINELEAQGKEDLIDKLVLVAVPQVGTPKAVASLLHGYGQRIGPGGILLTEETARETAENMPGAYGLLPSNGYFNKVSDPVIVFDDDSSTTLTLRGVYGEKIADGATLSDFIIGERDSREEPDRDDLLTPNVGNPLILSQAQNNQSILDTWTPPENIEVTQIAGWGLSTLKGIEYKDKEITKCENIFSCDTEVVMDHEPIFTVDGDETVVSPSAEYLSTELLYYLDFNSYNDMSGHNKKHATVLTVDPVLELIGTILKEEESPLPAFITETKPTTSDESLRLSVHSPVSISATDGSDNFTGLIDDSDLVEIAEEVPNSYYLRFGDGKYVGIPHYGEYDVVLHGEDTGTFTLSIETISNDEIVVTESFIDIPVNKETEATLTISQGDVESLNLDVNGDGEEDVALSSGDEFSSTDYIAVLREMMENADVEQDVKDGLLDRLDNVERNLEKGNLSPVDSLLQSMTQTLQNELGVEDIIQLINILRTKI